MTEDREPTLADLMAAITSLAAGQEQIAQQVADSEARLTRRLDGLEDRMIDRFAKGREDAAGVKLAIAGLEAGERDTAEAVRRHVDDGHNHRHAA